MAERETNTESSGTLRKRRQEFESYASAKANEIDEQRLAWRYYHGSQYTADQLRVYRERKQPVITFDRTSRKVDGLVGVMRKLRTDPKAFPRTSNQEQGADVATQVIRTVCDASRFEDLEAECGRDGAVHGIGVTELTFVASDRGDPDFELQYVDPRTFFYDPRSTKPDFSDARYMGTYKWVGLDELEEMVPGASQMVSRGEDGSYWTAFDSDREMLWTDEKQRVRLVDHWYIERGAWRWCLHVGTSEIQHGDSPFVNDKGKSLCKFRAFSNLIDQDGDRYGFVRRLKGPQDAMNQHRSKALHIMNTRQIVAEKGALDDVEATRKEAARPDGVIIYNPLVNGEKGFSIEQPDQEFLQQTQYYQDAKSEIDQFGPNPALLGDLGKSASGRAYAMAQQAGLAEMGPFLKNFRMWKLEQYESIWWTAQRYWTAERFLRVTDDEGMIQFMKVNGVTIDNWGQPALVNALGSINVDIVIDEGPDTETVMGDVFDIMQSLVQNGVPIPPAAIIETSALPGEQKKKLIAIMQKPDPAAEAAKKVAIDGEAAKVEETRSKTMLNVAKARSEGMPDAPAGPGEPPLPMDVQVSQAAADIQETLASADLKRAQAGKATIETMLAPRELAQQERERQESREERIAFKRADIRAAEARPSS